MIHAFMQGLEFVFGLTEIAFFGVVLAAGVMLLWQMGRWN